MQAAFLYKEQIKEDIIYLSQLKKQKGSERNILNKWFQDSIKNYFLETYASPFLKNELGEGFVKKVKQNIEKKMLCDGLKFMNLLNQYKIELEQYGKAQKFVNSLISIIIDDQKLERGSALWAKQAKKKFVALMLIVLMDYSDGKVTSFYDMWNYIFPSETQIKKKLSKDDKMRLKYSSNTNILLGTSPINSSTTLGYQQYAQATKNYQIHDNSSQCSRTCDFQEIENAPIVAKKFKIEPKQENYENQYINQQYQQQQQQNIQQQQAQQFQFIPAQSFQTLKQQQEMLLRPHSNSQINQQYNPSFLNTPDFIRRMSQALPLKQEVHEQELINLDDPQFFQDKIDEVQLQQQAQIPQYQQAPQTPLQFAQQPQLNLEQTLLQNLHNQQQVQHQGLYQFQEQAMNAQAVHIPSQAQQLNQLPTNPNNGYFYNNVDINNYFSVDQLFAQNNYAASSNLY
ncbi:hypothetical protein TTHERM_00688690 (macronuclear) [Tetrahymena thermophila SB210]|uniref:Uncharacterized protein n=1 Tax=Tetrahymena thermophila (strain SB210) TaxID=312017 RepID=I7MJL1_TETTS|nr:hypothetical protein TTHERM_00688690 [Tetrahymena thermophila SB210]EAS06729.1 hypothetical protein TTHERM_00688690 [Tetrahymena thermophila SB210]|eukprot:XP_001026971.1 hypothetical protein TTHERM_00688690 [Tetrahymena thermophila SB210]